MDLDRSLPAWEPNALGAGGEGITWEDAEQLADDLSADAWREYDREDALEAARSRIGPDVNTVPGIVVGRYDAPPPREPDDPPGYTEANLRCGLPTVEQNRVVEDRTTVDLLSLLQQIGALPVDALPACGGGGPAAGE